MNNASISYRTLGRTGLRVSAMGLGTGGASDPLGQQSGWPESRIHAFIHRAFDLGINLFDTAPGYMDSELILGRALKALPRADVVVSTKIALAGGMPGKEMTVMRGDQIEAAVDTSLRRLQMEWVDLLLIAVAGPAYYDLVVNEHLPVLQRLQRAGKVRFLGTTEQSRSDGDHAWLRKILPVGACDVAMVAHNLINQSAQQAVLPLCRQMNLGVINIFTVRRALSNPARLEEVLADLRQRNMLAADPQGKDDNLQWLREEGHAGSMVEAAYRYAAFTPGVTTVMTGTKDEERLVENVRNLGKGPLPSSVCERLGAIFGRVAEPIGN